MIAAALALVLAEPPREPAVALRWTAPPTCPDAAAVLYAITVEVDAAGGTIGSPPVVEADVTATASGYRIDLRLQADAGERRRSLEAARCDSLVDAVVLEVALLFDARRAAAEPARELPPPEEPSTIERPRTPARSRPTLRPTASRPAVLWLRAGASLGARVLAGSIATPTIGVAVRWRGAELQLDLAHWPAGFATLPGRTREGARLALSTLTASGCARWDRDRFALLGCGGLDVGVQWSRGVGLDRSVGGAGFALAAVPSAAIVVAATRWFAVALGPWLRVGIVRPGVRVDGVGEIQRAASWAAGGTLRLEFAIAGRIRRARGI